MFATMWTTPVMMTIAVIPSLLVMLISNDNISGRSRKDSSLSTVTSIMNDTRKGILAFVSFTFIFSIVLILQ